MTSFFRCIRSDSYKFRHTSMLLVHIFIPVASACMFLAYYLSVNWEISSKIRRYFELTAIAFPLIIGLICSKAIEQESQAGKFQVMLCSTKSRTTTFLSKLTILLFMGIFSTILAVGIFAIVFKTAPYSLYLKTIGVLIIGNVFIYILHLFVGLQYGSGACIGLGIAESLISVLALTGLGDGILGFFPCTWSARLCGYLVYVWQNPSTISIDTKIIKIIIIATITSLVALAFCILWFSKWEGGKCYD